ncbi:ABC transporter permease [Patescibacteria group bacterium]|nr:ABC transporter permease [Patescibacteria group bacterium]MBU1472497.1 ABC transporter permease [Patescibacteria group bacterium]MBU2459546.1 ABC transporter permease [Patescibacteria group bacterium]MBU2543865.1 ABC transporter permease [Patescibacteria group bacterium]
MTSGMQHFFELLFAMTEKELRARYKHTVFGFFWLVANPLLQMLIIGFVFTFFMKEPILYYNYYLFVGLLAWNFFSLSLAKATSSIVFERSLIKKAAFPREVIPISILLSNAVHFLAALVLYTVPVAFLGTLTPESILYILSGLLLLFAFTIGISLLTAALNVRFRDINFFVQALLIIWFYATPIVYSFSMIPYKFIWLWRLNPLTSVVQLLQHGFVGAPPPGPAMLGSNIVATITICAVGVLLFKNESKNFDDWV